VSALDLGLVVLLAQLVGRLAAGGGTPIRGLVLAVISGAWLLALARSSLQLWQNWLVLEVGQRLGCNLLQRLLLQPYHFHLAHDRAELNTRLQLQLRQLQRDTLTPLVQAYSNGVTVLLIGAGLWLLAGAGSLLLLLLVICGYGVLVLLLRPVLQRQQRRLIAAELEASSLVVDALGTIRRLLLEGGQAAVVARQVALGRRIVADGRWAGVLPQLPRQLVEPLGLAVLLLLLLAPQIRGSGSETLPWLALLTVGLLRLSQPLQRLAESVNRLQAGRPLLVEMLPLLELPLPESDGGAGPAQELPWEQLQLCGVRLGYGAEQPWVLENIDLTLRRGERLALVGASGSGKSTLAAVLLGLLTPELGKLAHDGRPLKEAGLAAWRYQCAEVGQPAQLLRGTVAANLAGWGPEPPEAELWEALEQVQLAEQVRRLPRGLATVLGESGQGLSGGERQRLAMAAALLRRPKLLVLDEATSGVQEALAETILAGLEHLPQRPAVVVITHREAVMRCCGRVVLLEGGRIGADGPLAALKQTSQPLQELLAQQRPRSGCDGGSDQAAD
jgi:ATP-binding cassette subfamily B protein